VWGGDPAHAHEWEEFREVRENRTGLGLAKLSEHYRGGGHKQGTIGLQVRESASCACGAWYGALGLEPTPELYVEHMVDVFREVRRVLRKDGTLWLNLGDSYAGGGQGGGGSFGHERPGWRRDRAVVPIHARTGLKPKDLVGIPWRVAFALQADGWYLRSDIIWHKPNPMPESVTDRPTKAHEYVFLMTKSERYYYDADAIREPVAESSLQRVSQNGGHPKFEAARERREAGHIAGRDTLRPDQLVPANGRNKRSVWTIATRPYPGAHFATFPEDLVDPCVLAGSSPKACGVCGAPWERVTELVRSEVDPREARGKAITSPRNDGNTWNENGGRGFVPTEQRTLGWRSTCEHEDDSGACVVLDPFNGSGTTGIVAIRHGRRYVGLDISAEYLTEQAMHRVDDIQHVMPL